MELLYFGKWNFLAPRLNNFRRELSELEKLKKITLKIFIMFFPKKLKKIKEVLIFSQKKAFLIFWDTELFFKNIHFRRKLYELEK